MNRKLSPAIPLTPIPSWTPAAGLPLCRDTRCVPPADGDAVDGWGSLRALQGLHSLTLTQGGEEERGQPRTLYTSCLPERPTGEGIHQPFFPLLDPPCGISILLQSPNRFQNGPMFDEICIKKLQGSQFQVQSPFFVSSFGGIFFRFFPPPQTPGLVPATGPQPTPPPGRGNFSPYELPFRRSCESKSDFFLWDGDGDCTLKSS